MKIQTEIPVNRSYMDPDVRIKRGLVWDEIGHFKHVLRDIDETGFAKPIVLIEKKFEDYKTDRYIYSKTMMYIYNTDGALIEKVHRDESQHNESHRPELNDPGVIRVINQMLRNNEIDTLL